MNNNEIKGTQTEKNLWSAYASEATSLIKYRLFAEESDYQLIEKTFLDIAENEEEHAEVFLERLKAIGKDEMNLKNSIALEGFASNVEYREFSKIAKEEGFEDISKLFLDVAKIEERHKKTFEKLLRQLEQESLLKKRTPNKWICLKCGFIYEGYEPPEDCPVCGHSKDHFKLYKEEDY